MAVFDDIKLGLEQAIEYEKGDLKAKKTTMAVLPLETFTSAEIKERSEIKQLIEVLEQQLRDHS